jgi:hypothetical protein
MGHQPIIKKMAMGQQPTKSEADNGTSTHHQKNGHGTATHQAKMHSKATNGTPITPKMATGKQPIMQKYRQKLKCVLTLVDGESNPSIEKNLEHVTKWSTSFAAGWNTFTRDILQQSRLNPKPLAFAIMANGEPFI